MQKINLGIFFVATCIVTILTFVTFIAAFAIDEGTGGSGFIMPLLAKMFNVFRFPTHTLFFNYIFENWFYPGLLINCVFYGLIIERLFLIFKKK